MEIAQLILEYLKVLIWPITALIALFTLRKPIIGVINRIKKADLPGGVSIDIGEQIATAHELAEKAQASVDPKKHNAPTLPLTEANTRMVQLGLQPTPSGLDLNYYYGLASQNPSLALAGLRMELEIIIRNLLKGFNLEVKPKESIRRSLDRLLSSNCITSEQGDFLIQILSICNEAMHTQSISKNKADEVIDLAGILLGDYLSWLEWGFQKE